MEKKKIIEAKDVSVKFHVRNELLRAIRHVSLDLYDGEILAIVGESGSGKSVFTKTFTGMLESNGFISGGSIMYEGKDLAQLKTDKDWRGIRGKEIATIFQDPMTSLDPIMKIGKQIVEVIEKHQDIHGQEAKNLAMKLMEEVGIPDAKNRFNDYPFEYSGGMRQRIVIAIALACKPKVLICDEPTTALDVTIQAQILDLLRELQKDYQFTTIFITHDLGVVANIADRVAVMYAGEIVEYGLVDEVFYDPRHPYTWSLLSSLPQLANKGEELFSIPGAPPSLYKTIQGDAFAPRNPYALKIDFEVAPPKIEVSPTHWAKTWLLDERAPKVDKPVIIQNLHEKMQEVFNHENRELGIADAEGGATAFGAKVDRTHAAVYVDKRDSKGNPFSSTQHSGNSSHGIGKRDSKTNRRGE